MAKKRDPLVALLDKEATELLQKANEDTVELKERQSIFREVVRYLGVKNKLDLFDEETDGGIAGFARELASPARTREGRRAPDVPATVGYVTDTFAPLDDGGAANTDGTRYRSPSDSDDPGGAFAPTADSVGSGRLGGDGDDDADADDDGSPGDLLRPGGATNGLAGT